MEEVCSIYETPERIPIIDINSGSPINLKKMAKAFRFSSDESFRAAQLCLKNHLYAATCNQSWYAVKQIITAATCEELIGTSNNVQIHYSDLRQSYLFRIYATKHNVWLKFRPLAGEIDVLRERKDAATQLTTPNRTLDAEKAAKSVETACAVREVILNVNGDRWNSHNLISSCFLP